MPPEDVLKIWREQMSVAKEKAGKNKSDSGKIKGSEKVEKKNEGNSKETWEEFDAESKKINSVEKIATTLGLGKNASVEDIMEKIVYFQRNMTIKGSATEEETRPFKLVLNNFRDQFGFWLSDDKIRNKLESMKNKN